MNKLSRRRFLALTGAGVVAVAAGGTAVAVRQLTGSIQSGMLSFRAVTGLPAKPFLSNASYVIDGNVNFSNGTGTVTKYVYAGPPENMTSIPLLTRAVHVTAVRQQGNTWHVSGVVDNKSQLQSGEDETFELLLDSSSRVVQSTFFGSPIQLHVQRFTTS